MPKHQRRLTANDGESVFYCPTGKILAPGVTAITINAHPSWSNVVMRSRLLIIGFLAMSVTASGGAFAESIYKWTDADGNIHYEDRPSADQSVELMKLGYKRTDSRAVTQRIQTRLNTQTTRREAKAAAAEEAKSSEALRAEAAEVQKRCQSYRHKLDTLVQSRRLYREDADGERVYLDDAERQEASERAEELVHEFCNS